MDPDAARERLVLRLMAEGHIRSGRVADALREVPRERFLPRGTEIYAYDDSPVPIGHGQTMSAPHMVAIMSEALGPQPGATVLEVGTGSGYQAAVLSRLVGPEGRVVSIERVPDLARHAQRTLRGLGFRNVEVHEGDGSVGLPSRAPFDRILVTAAAPGIPPPLLEQLAVGGRLLVPVGERTCELVRIDRKPEGLERTSLGLCAFVPLLGVHGQGAGLIR